MSASDSPILTDEIGAKGENVVFTLHQRKFTETTGSKEDDLRQCGFDMLIVNSARAGSMLILETHAAQSPWLDGSTFGL